jgi:hypothetical protein
VLKGDQALQQFTLHHYRETGGALATVNGPMLVSFADPSDGKNLYSYLMFLVREADGRYAPTGGRLIPLITRSILYLTSRRLEIALRPCSSRRSGRVARLRREVAMIAAAFDIEPILLDGSVWLSAFRVEFSRDYMRGA